MSFDLSQILRQFQSSAPPRAPTRAGVPGLAQSLSGDQPMAPAVDPYNAMRPPSTLPYADRFAGGALKSSYTPYAGDVSKYGFGPQHRNFRPDNSAWTTSPATSTGTNTASSTATDLLDGRGGGPDGGQSMANERNAEHGKAFDQMTPAELQSYAAGKEKNSIAGFSLPSIVASIIGMKGANFLEDSQLSAALANSGLSNPGDYVGGQIAGAANTGMNVAGGVANPELAGRSDPSQGDYSGGIDPAEAGSEGESPGMYAKGGVVKGDKKYGKDDVTINADGGEGVIRAVQMQKLGADFLKKLNTGAYDLNRLRKAVGLK